MPEQSPESPLYFRVGGYDAIAMVVDDLLVRLAADEQIGHFWQNQADDRLRRAKQLLIDFLCAKAGGPLYYMGRDMVTAHRGMKITESDWSRLRKHLEATLDKFAVPESERGELLALVESSHQDIVE